MSYKKRGGTVYKGSKSYLDHFLGVLKLNIGMSPFNSSVIGEKILIKAIQYTSYGLTVFILIGLKVVVMLNVVLNIKKAPLQF